MNIRKSSPAFLSPLHFFCLSMDGQERVCTYERKNAVLRYRQVSSSSLPMIDDQCQGIVCFL